MFAFCNFPSSYLFGFLPSLLSLSFLLLSVVSEISAVEFQKSLAFLRKTQVLTRLHGVLGLVDSTQVLWEFGFLIKTAKEPPVKVLIVIHASFVLARRTREIE
jgi:hypothetical protein